MKASKNWLCAYVDLKDISDEDLFREINAHVCEIESFGKMINANNLTIGHVLECEAIPDTHLHKCQVDLGTEVSQIVCGAPNVDKGVYAIVALPGAVLPGNFKIKASKIRGVESNGMLCSLQELGLEEKYVPERFKNGIFLFDEFPVKAGDDPLKTLCYDDTIIDLELTSNRSDLLSIEGIAYDLAATFDKKISLKKFNLVESNDQNQVKVKIETDKCYKYNARYLSNIKIKESPLFIKARLIASGIRPINNVVDITNYVLMELGQPLHSFDADKLGNNIVVRLAKKNEKMVTLDDIERTLDENDIVITDGNTPHCLGGVMGGQISEVTDETKIIVLEAAYFDPLSVRKTSTRLNLKSESSTRFERKIDYKRVERALDYAAYLLCEYADATCYKGVASEVKVELPEEHIVITADKINSVLGTSLSDQYVNQIFDRLNYTYKKNGLEYDITIPSRRMDLEKSVQDIIEDVARMNGYDNIPTTIAKTRDKGYLTYSQKRIRLVRQILSNMGLNETVNYSLIAKNELGLYIPEVKEPIEVLMPLTEERSVMRESVLNGLVDNIAYNKARKLENLSFFEISNVHTKDEEVLHLGMVINGLYTSNLWRGEKQPASFFLLKGIFEALCNKLSFKVSYEPCKDIASFHPGRCAAIIHKNKRIGVIGELHPRFAKEKGVAGTIALEIDMTDLITEENALKYQSINKYPLVTRDLAIVVKRDVLADSVLNSIKKACKSNITSVELFDVYTGENVGADEKSLAFNITFEDRNKTLETTEVDQFVEAILKKLEKDYNARLR